MKILQVLQFFSPKFGGTVNVLYNISKELSKLGHDVTIITTDYDFDEKYAKSIEDNGVKVIKFKCILNVASFLYSPSMKKWLKENLKEYDIIHMHNFRTYQQNIIFKYAKKYEIPYIVQAHGSILTFFQKQKLKLIYDYFWGNEILRNASNVIALTETESKQYELMGIPKNKIRVIANGINIKEYHDLIDKSKFREKYDIKNDEAVILYLGRLHENKGIKLLLNAFVNVLNNYESVKLLIVGPDDGFLSSLEKLVNTLDLDDKVLFTGPLYEDEKSEAYISADVFVTPSYSGFPITFLESCAYGLPIVTTNKGDKLNWIDNYVGYVVEYDQYQLSEAILTILVSDDLKNKFGQNGKNLARTKFNWQCIIHDIEKVYKKVTG